MKRVIRPAAVCLLMWVVLPILDATVSLGDEWSRFRGPNGQGISPCTGIPIRWTESDYNWKVTLPSEGHSSPIVWKNTVYVTCADPTGPKGALVALGVPDGAVAWTDERDLSGYRMNNLNSYASSTPVADSQGVYVLWPTREETTLVALDHVGQERWTKTFPGMQARHGPGGSPIVHDGMVVFTLEHEKGATDEDSAWIAVDCRNGQVRWRLPRKTSDKSSSSTPCVFGAETNRPVLLFTSFGDGLSAVDPCNGKVAWEAPGAFVQRVVSSPVIAGNMIFGSCGSGGAGKSLVAIRAPAAGTSTRPEQAYTLEGKDVPYVPTSLAYEGHLYTFHDRGQVACWNSRTGTQVWSEKPAGRYFGSPVCVDGKLYCITVDGDVTVVKAEPKYELLAVNPLGQKSHATPAVAAGRMYLRTLSQLISIGSTTQ